METMTHYTCPKCGTSGSHPENSKAPLCHRCDYKVQMVKEGEKKMDPARILAMGMLYTQSIESQERIKQCVKNLKSVLSTVPREEASIAYMVLSVDFRDELKK